MDPLSSLFERYRRDGDLQALGAVFDATAPRLLPIAMHLCRHTADAEDALQQTFVTAIDRAASFDASRRLEPWLAGILANVVRGARRPGRHRAESLPELASTPDEGPLAAAERAELVALLRTRVDALPAEQRQVLRLRLHHGLEPAAIAEALELPPGTVRMRLHRGLEALRRLLPASLAVALAGALPARGVAAVRAAVLDAAAAKAATAAAVTAAAAGASVAVVGGTLVMKKLAAAVVVLFALGTAWWWFGSTPSPSPREPQQAPAAPQRAAAGLPGTADAATPAAPQGVRTAAAAPVEPAAPAAAPGPTELWGLVVDAGSRQPIAHVDVELLHRDADEFRNLDLAYATRERSLARCRTDDRGRFRFQVERARVHRLAVRAAGYPPTTLLQRIGGSEVVVALTRGAAVDGVVRSGGQPVAGAAVRIAVRGEPTELAAGHTDGSGAFRFVDLPAASVFVQVTSPRFTEEWRQLDVVAGEQHHVEIELQPGGTVRGRVVDAETGAPIAGAVVAESWTLDPHVRTDPDGRFVLGGLRVQTGMPCYVHAPGFASAARDLTGQLEQDVVFRLGRGGTVTGRLVDAAGAVVTDAYVAVAATYMAVPGLGDCDWLPAGIGADGRFVVGGLRPELHYWLFVRARGFGTRVYALPRPLANGERHDVADVVLHAPARVEGRVVDDAGRPLPRVEVTIVGSNPDSGAWLRAEPQPERVHYFDERHVHTDAAGRFGFGALAAGAYELRAEPPGRNEQFTRAVDVADGGLAEGIELVVPRGLALAGSVERAPGAASEVLWLLASPEEGGEQLTARVARDGTFRFDGLVVGRYTVSLAQAVAGFVLEPLRRVEAGATDVRLVLERAATIGGRGVDDAGRPVRARVWSRAAGSESGSAVRSTDANGRFSLEVSPRFRGSIGAALADEWTRQVELPDVDAGRTDVLLALPPR